MLFLICRLGETGIEQMGSNIVGVFSKRSNWTNSSCGYFCIYSLITVVQIVFVFSDLLQYN